MIDAVLASCRRAPGKPCLLFDGQVLTYADLLALPPVATYRTLECISNEVGGDLMSNGWWTGVRLGDVLQLVGVQPDATALRFTSVDDYTETMSLAQALDPDTLLAYALSGKPLPAKHGFPVRVLGAGTYGMKNPKWLARIQVAASVEPGFWEEQGWDPDAPVQTMARTAAQLLPSLGPSTWVFWQVPWQPPGPGQTTLVARATDGTGQVQTDRRTDTFPQGATGLHTIQVRVAS
jgi:DMSO/TMAO reductase YedYZ molybdopterin-dependent catalytic subunit